VNFSFSQQVKIYGEIINNKKKVKGVLVSIFEEDVPYKTTYTNNKGKFFEVISNRKDYTILFYKTGYAIQGYRISNRLETNTQKIPIDINLEATIGSFDSILIQSELLKKLPAQVSTAFLKGIYEQSLRVVSKENKKEEQKILTENATKEEGRFKNFKQTIAEKFINGEDNTVTVTQIGDDYYELLINKKRQKRYTKNDKPITDITYYFETSRKYEGVLKSIYKRKEEIEKSNSLQYK